MPLFKFYIGICPTTEEKHGKPQAGWLVLDRK
jgi:hypothetical protein